MPPIRVALSIAGSDPTGGAGLQLDLQVFRALGVHGCAVPTALTVQDTAKVHSVLPLFPNVMTEQLRVLLKDVPPHAVKLGMLASDDVLRAVDFGLDVLRNLPVPIVIDPVLRASSGRELLERRAIPGLRNLIGRAAIVTPNLPEAEVLCERDVSTRAGIESAAKHLVSELGAAAALVKGGHRERDADDCLAHRTPSGVEVRWLAGERIPGGDVHGTGCALSAAIAAQLARGDELLAAVEAARAFVRAGIAGAREIGGGRRVLGFGGSLVV
ncbi:MAG: bifunctional hydroxymethylpyrimidine kinase/phosphomethylpyrimidine kinase [Deltaproteobacteria bacterium]|nr:bifunctional hydroxymethylpyrimidine kinase/phosphomethylpyrimidine kinase [Deltaproteobacteria bacterium]